MFKSYSDANKYIRKVGTEEVYAEAIDVESAPYTYEETDQDIPVQEEKTEEPDARFMRPRPVQMEETVEPIEEEKAEEETKE